MLFFLSFLLFYVGVSQYEIYNKKKRIWKNFYKSLYNMCIAFTSMLILWIYVFF